MTVPHTGRQTLGFMWWTALMGLCLVLVAPIFVVDVPPLGDYPNHLGRVFILASLPGDAVLARFYAAHWAIIPNLALDLVAPALIHLLPVHVVGRLAIAAAVLLPALGTIAYNTALGGRWWALGVGLIAYNICLLYGFLNFEISIGIALLLAGAWLRWRETRPLSAVALAMIGAPVLFACHLMGLVFFAALIGGAELLHVHRNRTGTGWVEAIRRGAILLLIFATPAVLYALSALRQLGDDAQFLPFGKKLMQLATSFVNYNWILDMTTAFVVFVLPVLAVLLRRGRVPAPAAIAMVLLLVTFLAAPYAWKGTYGLDTRFAIMLGFMLFAGFVPARWPAKAAYAAATLLILLFTARMALLTTAWVAHRADLADLRTVLSPLQPGQAVFVAEAGMNEAPAYSAKNPRWRLLSNGERVDHHIGGLVLIEYRAYWPFEFDNPSQQPIETLEPYRSLAARVGHLPDRATAAIADVCGFDYVLLTGADSVPQLPAERFALVAQSGYAALYTIVQCAAPVARP